MKPLFYLVSILSFFIILSCNSSSIKIDKKDREVPVQYNLDSNNTEVENESLIEQVLTDSNVKYIYVVSATDLGLLKIIQQILVTYKFEFDLSRIVFMRNVICNGDQKYKFFILIFERSNKIKMKL